MTASLPNVDDLAESIRRESGSEQERIQAAVAVAEELPALGDRLVTAFVQEAREAGCSWAQIGAQLGVSKQAAQQAFVAPLPPRRRFGRRSTPEPYERWTEPARRALEEAEQAARRLGHIWIGNEHLLEGLAAGEGVAADVLRGLDVGVDDLRQQVEEIIGRGPGGTAAEVPQTPRTKKVLALAVREAAALRSDHVGTEHLLLALVREGQGVACQILVRLGVDLRTVPDAVHAALKDGGPRTPRGHPTG